MTHYSELKRLALASLECQVPVHQLAHDYAFEQAAKPGLIWQLIEKYEALIAENERLKSDNRTVECRFEVSEDTLACIRGCLRSVEADIDQLKAENEALCHAVASAQSVLEGDLTTTYREQVNGQATPADLHADIEKLRAALGMVA